jgi:hypothetical protein
MYYLRCGRQAVHPVTQVVQESIPSVSVSRVTVKKMIHDIIGKHSTTDVVDSERNFRQARRCRCKGTSGGGLDGCAGATPHSGKPFGRSMRFGSQSSLLVALSFYPRGRFQKKGCVYSGKEMEGTDEIFFPDVKLLSVLIETQFLLAAHLTNRECEGGVIRYAPAYLSDLLAL